MMTDTKEHTMPTTTWTYEIDGNQLEGPVTEAINTLLAAGMTAQQAANRLAADIADNVGATATLTVDLTGESDDGTVTYLTGTWTPAQS